MENKGIACQTEEFCILAHDFFSFSRTFICDLSQMWELSDNSYNPKIRGCIKVPCTMAQSLIEFIVWYL